MFNEAYEKIRVAGSHFGTYGHTIDLVILIVSESVKNSSVVTIVQPGGAVFLRLTARKLKKCLRARRPLA